MTNIYKDAKVFIAGAAGLVGQALVRALVPLGAKITATEFKNRKIDAQYRDEIRILLNWDLTDPRYIADSYKEQEIVFWCAAKVGGAKAIRENASEMIHYNLEMSSRNIRAAAEAGVKRFCYLSSSYTYPDLGRPNVEGDTDIGDVPMIHYGLGWIKRYIETLLRHYHMTTQMKAAIVRPAAIYGTHDDFDLETCHAVPALVRKVAERQNPLEVWGDGNEERQYTFADDLAEGLLTVTENFAVAVPINISTTQVSSVADVWRTLCDIAGLNCLVKYLADKPQVIQSRLVDVSLAKRLLGIECKTDLRTGLEKTLEWYKANHK